MLDFLCGLKFDRGKAIIFHFPRFGVRTPREAIFVYCDVRQLPTLADFFFAMRKFYISPQKNTWLQNVLVAV